MMGMEIDALERWIGLASQTTELLLQRHARGERVEREVAEHRKLLTRAERLLERLAREDEARRAQPPRAGTFGAELAAMRDRWLVE